MVNMGENRARNGVTDCPGSRNEEKNRKMDENGLGRYAPSHTSTWGGYHSEEEGKERKHRPRSSRKCDMEALAAVGQNMSTSESCTGMSCQLRLIVKEVLWKHKPVDCVSPPVTDSASASRISNRAQLVSARQARIRARTRE
ncbi:hypothetical protein E3N88_43551 [Mikania micrantha]|uniref:Uncharacterized protein n=1 Tax=Mikania micrantha TaxID=192012 RepID=A0A5N6LEL6_9ASTR|nr:hypothetical protein E3N88_43551 [Mikania micrantha]